MPKRYRFNRSQLAAYIDAFAGNSGEPVVIRDIEHGANTHIPQRVVSLPVGSPHAQDLAAHEALHITSTSPKAARYLDEGTMMLLNSLEDGRMERKSFHKKRGLRVQFQRNLVDQTMPQIKGEAWIIQAIKSMYLEVAGYEYDSQMLKPRAREFVKKFRAAGLRDAARAAKTTEDLLPIVERVFPLFDEVAEQIASRGRKAKASTQPQISPVEQARNAPWGNQNPRTGVQEPRSGEQTQGVGSDGSQPQSEAPSPESASSPAGAGAQGDNTSTGQIKETESTTYDADERRHEREAASRMGGHTQVGESYREINADGKNDKVVGGATSDSIRRRARSLVKKLDSIKPEATLWSDNVEHSVYAAQPVITQSKARSAGAINKLNWDLSEGKDEYGRVKVSIGSGKVGYDGATVSVVPVLRNEYYSSDEYSKRDKEAAANMVAEVGGYANALAMQMRTFSQTKAGRKHRSFERNGRLDVRRASQGTLGKLDIFREPDSGRNGGSAFVLSVDLSGSMTEGAAHSTLLCEFAGSVAQHEASVFRLAQDWINNGHKDKLDLDAARQEMYGRRGIIPPIYYALQASALMSSALSRSAIPHEVHTFSDHRVGVAKRFLDPLTNETLANMWTWGGGGTPAAEGLAVAWERLKAVDAKKRVVVQFTDGAVAENVKDLVQDIRREGGVVIGVGIGVYGADEDNRRLYQDFIDCKDPSELPTKMASLLRKLTMRGIIGE